MTTRFPTEALNHHVAILGKTGSGKTYAAKGLIERLLGENRQVCVIDPTGAWWGLRLSASGKKPANQHIVLLGGQHGDLPLSPTSGKVVARLVTEQLASVVLDTIDMTVGEYTRWFCDFAGELFRSVKRPLHLVIDEAHQFMPQARGGVDKDAGKMVHAGNRLMAGGRSRGIRAMLITQRPAKLHKDSLTCADALIAMRVLAPQDRDAVKAWIDGAGDPKLAKVVLDSLASLQKGEGWAWYPEGDFLERTPFPKIKTYDSSAAPEHGASKQPSVGQIDLKALGESMAEAVQEAEANDPKALQRKIRALEADLKRASKGTPPTSEIEALTAKAVTAAVAARDRVWNEGFEENRRITLENLAAVMTTVRAHGISVGPVEHAPVLNGSSPVVRPAPRPRVQADRTGDLSGPQQRIIDAIEWWNEMGVDEPSMGQIAFRAGYKPGGGSFNNYLSQLNTMGLIERRSGHAVLTDDGLAETGDISTGGGLDELHEKILDALRSGKGTGGPHARILEFVIARGDGITLSTVHIADAVGYAHGGGSFNNYLSRLSSLGLIERRAGMVSASKILFP